MTMQTNGANSQSVARVRESGQAAVFLLLILGLFLLGGIGLAVDMATCGFIARMPKMLQTRHALPLLWIWSMTAEELQTPVALRREHRSCAPKIRPLHRVNMQPSMVIALPV